MIDIQGSLGVWPVGINPVPDPPRPVSGHVERLATANPQATRDDGPAASEIVRRFNRRESESGRGRGELPLGPLVGSGRLAGRTLGEQFDPRIVKMCGDGSRAED